jgi:hypothetical protein
VAKATSDAEKNVKAAEAKGAADAANEVAKQAGKDAAKAKKVEAAGAKAAADASK